MSTGPNRRPFASRAFGPGLRRSVTPALAAAALAAAALAGCGSSQTATVAAGGAQPKRPRISAKLRAQEAAIHQQVVASLNQGNGATGRYGSIPANLRNKQSAPVNQVLHASALHPAIAIQGNGVQLHLLHGTALATAVGPDIPTRIQGSADLHTTATWDFTFADVKGTVPISPRLFTITDEQGALLWPKLSVPGGGPLPKTVPTGRPFTVMLSTVVSVGDGKLRYAPTGGTWLAEWDFDVETD